MSRIRHIILETLSQRGPLPLDKIARAARHSPIATRYHLGLLLDAGLVTANDLARREIVGRPQVLYALAERAQAHLPKQYAALAEQLLKELTCTLGERETRALLRRAGRRLAETAPPWRPGARPATRLNYAAAFLSARGYLARWEKSDDGLILYVGNCPYHQVTLAYRPVCEMDLALISGLLELPLKMSQCIADQDSQCLFVVRPLSVQKR